MPRIAGVSCTSGTRPILLSLRPISVARCEWWRRIALPVCWTLIIFAALAIVINSRASLGGNDLLGTPVSGSCPLVLFGHCFGVAADPARPQPPPRGVAAGPTRPATILMLQRIERRAN